MDGSRKGVSTDRLGVLTTDFFHDLTSTDFVWEKADEAGMGFALKDRATGAAKLGASRKDIAFGSNAQLRAVVDACRGLRRAAGDSWRTSCVSGTRS